jgi:hypothetical protein
MEDMFFSASVGDGRLLCVSPLSAKLYRESGGKGLGGDFGYFVYEINEAAPEAGVEVIAKAASPDAAVRLFELLVSGAARPIAA